MPDTYLPTCIFPHYPLLRASARELSVPFEPRREKPGFLHMRKQRRRSELFAVTAKLISAFVFATCIVQSLYFLNPKFQASSHLLWLYSPVCVGPGRKPRRPVFSERGSFHEILLYDLSLYCIVFLSVCMPVLPVINSVCLVT